MKDIILIVDDDATIRDTLRFLLIREGYEILTAPDGQAAIRLMATVNTTTQVHALSLFVIWRCHISAGKSSLNTFANSIH